MNEDMNEDWVEDEELSSEETLSRFRGLAPTPTRGPLPGGAVIMTVPDSYGPGVISLSSGSPLQISRTPDSADAVPA